MISFESYADEMEKIAIAAPPLTGAFGMKRAIITGALLGAGVNALQQLGDVGLAPISSPGGPTDMVGASLTTRRRQQRRMIPKINILRLLGAGLVGGATGGAGHKILRPWIKGMQAHTTEMQALRRKTTQLAESADKSIADINRSVHAVSSQAAQSARDISRTAATVEQAVGNINTTAKELNRRTQGRSLFSAFFRKG